MVFFGEIRKICHGWNINGASEVRGEKWEVRRVWMGPAAGRWQPAAGGVLGEERQRGQWGQRDWRMAICDRRLALGLTVVE
jgi:hypothetical protein